MNRAMQIVLLTLALAGVAAAVDVVEVPEIGAGAAVAAVGMLAGGLLVIRALRKR